MPNTFFRFKQFTVHQNRAVLKVSTDSCLFGAWVGREAASKKHEVRRVLDIGAGTGLLMLMLAQQCDAVIEGIEIDKASYEQARDNIESSSWKKRLQVIFGDVKEFSAERKYDFILSNPPFYENDLKSDLAHRNMAMHNDGLKFGDLLQVVNRNLSADGCFAVLLPFHRAGVFISMAKELQFDVDKRTDVKQTVHHSFFRSMLLFRRKDTAAEVNSIAIKDANNNYTAASSELLKDYYLYL